MGVEMSCRTNDFVLWQEGYIKRDIKVVIRHVNGTRKVIRIHEEHALIYTYLMTLNMFPAFLLFGRCIEDPYPEVFVSHTDLDLLERMKGELALA
jgi:hypothetical protein